MNEIKFDNDYIVKAANEAFREAYKKAKSHKLPIIKREGNKLVKIYPDGKKEIIKTTKMIKIKKEIFLFNKREEYEIFTKDIFL
jgi:DNA-binding protein YbaB